MLKKILYATLPLTMLFFAGCFGGEDLLDLAPAEKADIPLNDLIQKMVRVTDPKGLYAKARTYRMTQNVDSTDGKEKNTYTSIILYKAPDKLKQVSLKNGKPFNVVLSVGNRAWYIKPGTGKSIEIPAGTGLNLIHTFNSMLKPGNTLKDTFPDIKMDMKKDPRSGREYYRLICRVKDPNIAPYIFYVNSRNYLITKFETVLYGADGSKALYTAYSENYVWQGGIRKPKRSLITVGGKTDISNVVSFEINVDIPDSEFAVSHPWNQ